MITDSTGLYPVACLYDGAATTTATAINATD